MMRLDRLRRLLAAVLVAVVPIACQPPADPAAETAAVGDGSGADGGRYVAVPFVQVHFEDSFWAPRLRTNLEVTIPHILAQNELTGRVDNLRKGAGLLEGSYEGRRFNDTDVYKVMEAAAYAIAHEYDAALDAQLDALIEIIAAAQEDDGYLMPARTTDPTVSYPGLGPERWMYVSNGSHELYNAGHLIEAAVAHHAATGKRTFIDVAIRFADLIVQDFGPDGRVDIPGHEEIEIALVKLAEATGDARYLDQARLFIDRRGHTHDGDDYPEGDFDIYNDLPYKQDDLPVVEQSTATGHAVRAMYLYTGMADVAARSEAPGYRDALDRIWNDVVSTKMYLTGGIGSRGTFESFGEDYELPSRTAYTESCAAVGHDLWNHRMFLASGDPKYLDSMEKVLFNGTLSGIGLAGDSFFYTNPLESGGGVSRSEYFDVACCPANLARLMALLPGFVYSTRGDELFVNLFVGGSATVEVAGGSVTLRQETDYPWSGTVRFVIEAVDPGVADRMELAVRVPGWARGEAVASDLYSFRAPSAENVRVVDRGAESAVGDPGQRLVRFAPGWQVGDVVELEFPMPVRVVQPHPSIEDTVGKVALQRGPLVYAIEGVDNGGTVHDLTIDPAAAFASHFQSDLLGGVVAVTGPAWRGDQEVTVTAIPYFAWANRGDGEMAVWIPAR